MKKLVFSVLFVMACASFAWVLVSKLEGTPPVVNIKLPSPYLKKSYEMSLEIADQKTGLRKIVVSIMQTGKEKILLEKTYDPPGFSGLFSGARPGREQFLIPIESRKYGMTDGDAFIRVMVSDFSWRGWGKGNISYTEKKVVIDSTPPELNILTRRHNIERGGTGLIIYRLFEKNVKSGVKVGEHFFPGYTGMFEDEMIYCAFFALSHQQGPGTRLSVTVQDAAGNLTRKGFHHYIRDKRFNTDVLNISDRFLDRRIADFKFDEPAGGLKAIHKNPLVNRFLHVNSSVRQQNVDTVLNTPAQVDRTLHWTGRFLRLEGSARRAGFADRRIYKYKGEEIDRAYHLGIDLASTSNAPVKAANTGRVIFAGEEGIFGNTVIIDHGFGLKSLYSHLTRISARENEMITKGQVLGTTGLTGLAAGDHLHFSMIVHDVFVNPVEWWDSSWIKNNITSKIENVRQNPDRQ